MRNMIYILSKRLRKLTKRMPKTLEERRERNYKVKKFLDYAFKKDREEFINTFENNLQKGRVKSTLSSFYDDMGESYQQYIEKLFLYGWWYEAHKCNDGEVYEAMHNLHFSTKGCTNKTSLQYAKFLTEKYGKMLFIKPELQKVS